MSYKLKYITKNDLNDINKYLEFKFASRDLKFQHLHPNSYVNLSKPYYEDSILDQWNYLSFCVKNTLNEVVGFISYTIDREVSIANLAIANITNKPNPAFLKHVVDTFKIMFETHGMIKIYFSTTGEEQKKIYDAFIKKYGGRYIGYKKNDSKLLDGKIYDRHMWEVMKEEFKA